VLFDFILHHGEAATRIESICRVGIIGTDIRIIGGVATRLWNHWFLLTKGPVWSDIVLISVLSVLSVVVVRFAPIVVSIIVLQIGVEVRVLLPPIFPRVNTATFVIRLEVVPSFHQGFGRSCAVIRVVILE